MRLVHDFHHQRNPLQRVEAAEVAVARGAKKMTESVVKRL
jgi:hypothetical protein